MDNLLKSKFPTGASARRAAAQCGWTVGVNLCTASKDDEKIEMTSEGDAIVWKRTEP